MFLSHFSTLRYIGHIKNNLSCQQRFVVTHFPQPQYLKILSRLFSRFVLEYILDRMHSTDRIEQNRIEQNRIEQNAFQINHTSSSLLHFLSSHTQHHYQSSQRHNTTSPVTTEKFLPRRLPRYVHKFLVHPQCSSTSAHKTLCRTIRSEGLQQTE